MANVIFKKIMVATDGSVEVRKAVNSAIEIAKLGNSKLYAVYVVSLDGSSLNSYNDTDWKKAMKEHLITEGEEAIAYVESLGKSANIEIESTIIEGNPADEIVDFAEKNDIDLIVMGTQGKSAIQRFLIGSVAEKVVRHSKRPVLVVRRKNPDNLLVDIMQIL